MKTKSAGSSVVRMSAADIPPASPRDLARLRAAQAGPIDPSEIPERLPGSARARRTAAGKRPAPRKSVIREAILAELGRRELTRYQLWKSAHAYCSTLPESAVYEFLRGERQIGLPYVEALMAAMDLIVRQRRPGHPMARVRDSATP